MRNINVVLTKEAFEPHHSHARHCAIVLDIIFATSSIVAALGAGARHIYPALDLPEAEKISQTLAPGSWLLAGESNARAFEGYYSFEPLALGNPAVAGKDIIYATTNGTVALRQAAVYEHVYAASLANASAVIRHVLDTTDPDADIVLVCAGSRGHFSLEDFYGAGCLVHVLKQQAGRTCRFSDAALAAALTYENTCAHEVLASTRMAAIMAQLGMADNIAAISSVNTSQVVSFYDGITIQNIAE